MADLAKAVAILLVVIGHYYPADSPVGWTAVNRMIYKFHIPVFFFVAGYTWHVRPGEQYISYLARKAKRLLVPYFAVATFYLGVKILPSSSIDLASPVTARSILNVFIDPVHSYLPLLWFLYALFVIQGIFPIIHRVGFSILPGVLLGATLLHFDHTFFCGGAILTGLLHFMLGVYIAHGLSIDIDGRTDVSALRLAILLCVVLFGGLMLWQAEVPLSYVQDTCLGLAGVGVTIMTCMLLSQRGCSRWVDMLSALGASSMTIYLFHTLFEGSMRVGMYHLAACRNLPFFVKAIPCIVMGVAVPYAAERLLIRRHAVLRSLFLGVS